MAKKYTDEDLIEILQQKTKELGRSPKAKEVKQCSAIIKHFGSFNKGLEAAGLKPNRKRSKNRYTKEKLIEILQKRYKELGRTPKTKEVAEYQIILKHFGSFNAGLKAAGLTPNTKEKYTEDELISELQKKAKELGRTPKMREIEIAQTYINRFGSFNKALEAAGLIPNKKTSKK